MDTCMMCTCITTILMHTCITTVPQHHTLTLGTDLCWCLQCVQARFRHHRVIQSPRQIPPLSPVLPQHGQEPFMEQLILCQPLDLTQVSCHLLLSPSRTIPWNVFYNWANCYQIHWFGFWSSCLHAKSYLYSPHRNNTLHIWSLKMAGRVEFPGSSQFSPLTRGFLMSIH